jgi:DNA-binding ferritin-like protein (Dps family)
LNVGILKMIDEKRRWRQYRARITQLPENYRTAAEALERYLLYHGSIANGDILLAMHNDLADLFEQSVANDIPIRTIVGEDPVEFAEEFLRNYSEGQWINKERERLIKTIDQVAAIGPE